MSRILHLFPLLVLSFICLLCNGFVLPTCRSAISNSAKPFLLDYGLFSTESSSSFDSSILDSSSKVTNNHNTRNGEKSPSATSSNQDQLEQNYPQFPRTWVPLASTLELDPDRPNRLEFLENSYVVFRGRNNNEWVVMDNACPHRLAPLSEGRIEPNSRRLQCSYHGWTFETDGSCTRIPQATATVQTAATQNPRSCLASYSTYVDPETAVLWIWPWKEDVIQFAGDVWRHPEGIMGKEMPSENQPLAEGLVTYSREHPYGWDTLVENLIDPAHIPFAHHGMQGNRNDAIPINMTRANDRGPAGFSFEWEDRTMGMLRKGTGEFRAPYLVTYDAQFDAKDKESPPRIFQLSVFCIPTKPGWSRVMTFTGAPPKPKDEDKKQEEDRQTAISKKKSKTSKKTSLARALLKMFPPWTTHLFSNKFFDSDLAFLHYQEKEVNRRNNARKGQNGRDSAYFMPAECDRSIVALYDWIQKYAASYTQKQALHLPPAIYDRSRLFDRWGQHTSQCKICQDALKSIQKWKQGSQIVLVASVLLGFRYWAPRLVAVACLGWMKTLAKLEGTFYEGEFKHYENH